MRARQLLSSEAHVGAVDDWRRALVSARDTLLLVCLIWATLQGFGNPAFSGQMRKDPLSGNLDRIQSIKGWLAADGETQEKVYDVVWSGDREPGVGGKLPPVGNTVDVANATWTNTIGVPELITVWADPDFDPTQRSFYYVRVLEIPTPRWTAYEAKYFKVQAPEESPMTTQERAYTSPIWYTP